MPRFRLDIEYAGTRYSGWQVQKNARTVAGEIEAAVRKATDARDLELYGSGRTDAGVHALLQVAHLDVRTTLAPLPLRLRINDALPADIHVLGLRPAHHRFHARHAAVARSYVYQISRRRTALAKPFVWWIKDELDASRMAAAAALFEGLHDFRSFTDQDAEDGSTRVRVEAVTVKEDGALVLVRVVGSHFLWKMVRRMVGVLAGVGRGQLAPDDVSHLLRAPSPLPAELTAPPSGLFLEGAFYEGEPYPPPLAAPVPVPSRK